MIANEDWNFGSQFLFFFEAREDPEILEKLEASKKDEILLLVARKAGGQKLRKEEIEKLSQSTGLSKEDIMDLGNYVIRLVT